MTLELNPEQQAGVEAVNGDFVMIAGPGSGKTRVLVERYLQMRARGIPDRDILNLTFTSSAATEMVARVGLLNSAEVFRTFHSFCLDLMKRERAHIPFPVCPTIIPVRGEQFLLMKDLLKRYPPITSYNALNDRITQWKAENVSTEQALNEEHNAGVGYFYALAYRDYERDQREQGWLDFDALMKETVKLLEVNEDVRKRNQRKYIAVDECQDTDTTQFRLLQLLYGGNIFVVGDENQCQPPGTMVQVLNRPASGRSAASTSWVPIEFLIPETDKLISWDSHEKRTRLGRGRKFRRAKRLYSGRMLRVYSNGHSTRMTPNHFVWTKFNINELETGDKNHFVYLMWKEGFGFRVGTSRFRRVSGANQLSHRGYQEGANKMWVLKTASTAAEAETLEEIYSLKYGIPECTYHNKYQHCKKTENQIRRVFDSVTHHGGYECLDDHGLLFDYPLVNWPGRKHLCKFHGYFKTVAANLIPGLMVLPTDEPYKSAVIKEIKVDMYSGPVYSLDVEKDHTYIADGIPVGNCIYEWRSAKSGNLSNFSKTFPGAKTLFLGSNYRSSARLVDFFKKVLPVDNGIASHMFSMRPVGEDVRFIRYRSEDEEANEVLNEIVNRNIVDDSAILARTNRQLQLIQRRAMSRNIKAEILGKKNVWQENEVKHLIELTKEQIMDPRPAAVVMQALIKEHNLVGRYSNTRGNLMEKDPVENINDVVRMAGRKHKETKQPLTVLQFLEWLRKITYMRRTKTEPILTLSTVHQAKGREWRYVYVVGCDQGTMPHKEGDLPEEQRIFFVACSRAADELQISFYKNRSQFLNDFVEEIEEFGEENDA